MKRIKILTLFFVFVALPSLSSCTNNGYAETEINTMGNITVYNDFLPAIENVDSLLNGDFSGLIYFGRDTCFFCLEFNRLLKGEYDNQDLMIYMFDTDDWRDYDSFSAILEKFSIVSVPTLLYINSDGTFEAFEMGELDNEYEFRNNLLAFLLNN